MASYDASHTNRGTESPRFLVKNGKYRESYRSLIALREVPLLAARDLFYMHVQLLAETKLLSRSPTVELGPVLNTPASEMPRANTILEDLNNKETYQNEIKKITYWDRILQLATIPRVRRSAVAAFAVMSTSNLNARGPCDIEDLSTHLLLKS